MAMVKCIRSAGVALLMGAAAFALTLTPAEAVIIGVNIEAGQGSPTNWTSYTLADVGTTTSNLIAEDGSVTTASFLLSGVTSPQNFGPSSGAVIPSHSNDLTKVCCDILFDGPNPTVAVWSGLVPLAIYNYWVFVSSTAEDTITIAGNTVDVFASPSIGPETQAINGILGSSALTFASYARQVEASAAGTISVSILSTGTPTPSGYAIELVSAISVPEPATLALLGLGLAGLGVARRRKAA